MLRWCAFLIATLFCFEVAAPSFAAAATPGEQLQALYTRALHNYLKRAPEAATFLGDYRYDAYWSTPGMGGVRQGQRFLRQFEAALNRIDFSHASLHDRNDLRLARAFVASQKRAVAETLQGKDPGAPALGVVGVFFTMLLHKDEQNSDVWWNNVISRMEKAPAFLAGQKALITHPGRLQAEVAQQQLAQAPALFTYILTPMATSSLSKDKLARFMKARDGLVASLTAWNTWLSQNAASWPQNYAMGRTAYESMLKNELLLPYDATAIETIGQRTLDAAIADQQAILAEAKAKGVNLQDPLQAAKVGGGLTPATKDAQFAFFQSALDTLKNFIQQHNIVTIPPYVGVMKIETTPAFLQPVLPGPSMNAPPLLSKETNGIYFIPPPNAQMAAHPKLLKISTAIAC